MVHTVRHRNRPAAPLVCRSSRIRYPSAPAPVPAPRKKSARLPAEVLKLQDFSFYQSISNFVVSLPNVSEKDVKGLLFRKQPLHTSPNFGANVCELSHTFLRAMRASPHLHPKGEAGASRLSSLRYLSSPPRLRPRVQDQNECSKPTKFDELTLALLLDTIDVFLAEVKNAAPIDSRSKLERRACFVLFRC